MNETLEVYRNHNDGLEVSENDAACNEENEIKVEHLSPDENADAVFKDDEFEDQPVKPDVIKKLFKGTFSENLKEVLENLNKFNKIGFGRSHDVNELEANFHQENQICVETCLETLAEDHDVKDSQKEILQVSEVVIIIIII